MKCEKCGQISIDDVAYKFDGQNVCKTCYDHQTDKLYNWNNPKLAISMMLSGYGIGEEPVTVPLFENLQEELIMDDEYPDVRNAFEALKQKWEAAEWGCTNNACCDMKLVEIDLKDRETVKDSEFYGLHIFKALAIDPEFYSRPFDESPDENYFVNWFSADCYAGRVYSKDFAYEVCDECNRTICFQNPSNGWHVQMHITDGGCICNKCYEENALIYGINDDFDGESIPGQFFNYKDIEENGWEKVEDSILAGSGYSGYRNPEYAISIIQKWIDAGRKVLVNYENMAIGGLGGYVSIYIK